MAHITTRVVTVLPTQHILEFLHHDKAAICGLRFANIVSFRDKQMSALCGR